MRFHGGDCCFSSEFLVYLVSCYSVLSSCLVVLCLSGEAPGSWIIVTCLLKVLVILFFAACHSNMSIFLRLNVCSQVSVTGHNTNFATMLSTGGDVHFQIHPGRLYNIALYQMDGTLLGYVRVDVPSTALSVGVVRPMGGDDGGDNRGGNGSASGGLRAVPGGSSVTVSGGARARNDVQMRLASISDLLANLPGTRNNPITVDDGSGPSDCGYSMDGDRDIDMFIS